MSPTARRFPLPLLVLTLFALALAAVPTPARAAGNGLNAFSCLGSGWRTLQTPAGQAMPHQLGCFVYALLGGKLRRIQTVAFTSTAPVDARVGGTYQPTAVATSGLPATIGLAASSTGCALTSGVVSFTAPGTCVLNADQAGNATYGAARRVQQSFAVGAAPQQDPTAVDDAVTVARWSTGTTIDVLANDTAPAGVDKDVVSVSQPAHGTVTLGDDGTVSYAPAADYCNRDADGTASGSVDTFTYELTGGSTATVSVTVQAPDLAPELLGLTRQRGTSTPVAITDFANNQNSNQLVNDRVVTLRSTWSDPGACGTDSLTHRWVLAFPEVDPYRVAGITGYDAATLVISPNALLRIPSPPGMSAIVSATSSVTGRRTEVNFYATVPTSSMTIDLYNQCRDVPGHCGFPEIGPIPGD